MRAEEFRERRIELEGWPVNITSYKAGDVYHAQADNVQPGARLARATAPTREASEKSVIEQARTRLARTQRYA